MDAETSFVLWTFNSAGSAVLGGVDMDRVVGTDLDPTRDVLYVKTLRSGTQDSLWALDPTEEPATVIWSTNVGSLAVPSVHRGDRASNSAVCTVIATASRSEQVHQNAAAIDWELDAAERAAIDALASQSP